MGRSGEGGVQLEFPRGPMVAVAVDRELEAVCRRRGEWAGVAGQGWGVGPGLAAEAARARPRGAQSHHIIQLHSNGLIGLFVVEVKVKRLTGLFVVEVKRKGVASGDGMDGAGNGATSLICHESKDRPNDLQQKKLRKCQVGKSVVECAWGRCQCEAVGCQCGMSE